MINNATVDAVIVSIIPIIAAPNINIEVFTIFYIPLLYASTTTLQK
jgi:hypothetical protein